MARTPPDPQKPHLPQQQHQNLHAALSLNPVPKAPQPPQLEPPLSSLSISGAQREARAPLQPQQQQALVAKAPQPPQQEPPLSFLSISGAQKERKAPPQQQQQQEQEQKHPWSL
jgi:hypothetical protein